MQHEKKFINRTVLYFKNVVCNLEICRMNHKKQRCIWCDLLCIKPDVHAMICYTVKPVDNGHSMEKQKVAVVGRWPLYRGSKFSRPYDFFLSYKT